ncbi:hypothetical protein Mgra_00008284 [Meloidogyne graminicola]|uniref:Uncharacterized protein n=1 Tax=Meloidogyne graminicola TaxID=189291 RepID=A0A8S9ZG67_9BILA|nr:hypothetical protein Mgra_00008284 [Meloidogyne graminicola]
MEKFINNNLKRQQKLAKFANGKQNNLQQNQPFIGDIPAIQITQMTLDEEENSSNNKEEKQQKLLTELAAECSERNFVTTEKKCSKQDNSLLTADKYQDRSSQNRQSTGTLNRLILVAQALETEVDWRRRNDVNTSRIIFTLRMANIVLLLLVNLLIFTGVGQYHRNGIKINLFLTLDKWNYQQFYSMDELPFTFSEMRLTGQFFAAFLSITILLATVLLQSVHCLQVQHSKMLCIFYAFGCVPISLFIFGLEMHYSACPWLDDFYQSQLLRRNFNYMENYFDTQCGINGWALAGIFSLLSCGLFVSDGLISAFFRHDNSHNNNFEKSEAIL